jgi:hypothetical protein
MFHPFFQTRLVYQVLEHIHNQRQELMNELVSYSQDPVRRARRLRMLSNLSEYEQNFLEKIRNFETNNNHDLNDSLLLAKIKAEVDHVVDREA